MPIFSIEISKIPFSQDSALKVGSIGHGVDFGVPSGDELPLFFQENAFCSWTFNKKLAIGLRACSS